MPVNKVIYGGVTLLDLTEDTVTAEKLLKGETAHGKDGSPIVGTLEVGGAKMTYGSFAPTEDATVLTSDKTTSYVVQHDLGEIPTVFILWHESASRANGLNLYVYNYEVERRTGRYSTKILYGYHEGAGNSIMKFSTCMHAYSSSSAFIADEQQISLTSANNQSGVYLRTGLTYYWVAYKLEG